MHKVACTVQGSRLQKSHAVFTRMLRKDHCLPVNKTSCISLLHILW